MQSIKPTIQTFADSEHLAQAAAARFVQQKCKPLMQREPKRYFTPGGGSPQRKLVVEVPPTVSNEAGSKRCDFSLSSTYVSLRASQPHD